MKTTSPWQFSLRALFLLTACVAAGLSVLFGFPDVLAVTTLICLVISLPALLGTVMVHGSSYQRTFCFGALFPAGVMLFCIGSFLGYILFVGADRSDVDILWWIEIADHVAPHFRVFVGSAWTLSILIGALCIIVRWLMESRQPNSDEQARTDATI